MLLEKIRNKNNLPIILFFVILINYLPLILPNIVSKESNAANIIFMGICFAFQIILLLISFWKKIEFTKENIKMLKILSIVSIILIIVQIINFFIENYKLLDLVNIICQFINITLLIICLTNFQVEEKYIINFMKAILIMGVIACIVNMILYFKEIFQIFLGNLDCSLIKSFFANRNQFAFFLYISIIANVFLLLNEKKVTYKLLLILLLMNLFFTMSRTGILVVAMFLLCSAFGLNKSNIKRKIIYLTLTLIFGIILILVLCFFKPELIEQLFRLDSVKNLSGRTAIWKNGINLWLENPINMLFGTGRFNGNDVLHIKEKNFTQFHNIYLDFLITGGVLELCFIIYIYSYVINKIKESNMDIKYKKIYKITFITYFIYAFFESVGRFSIGATDTICLIFFISIPLLYSNSTKDNKN